MEELDLPEDHVLSELGESLRHIYFPSTAILSWQKMLASGDCTEVAMVGREGLLGLYMLIGASAGNNRGVVQTAGQVIRIKVKWVLQSFRSHLEVQRRIMLFAQALILQMSQCVPPAPHAGTTIEPNAADDSRPPDRFGHSQDPRGPGPDVGSAP